MSDKNIFVLTTVFMLIFCTLQNIFARTKNTSNSSALLVSDKNSNSYRHFLGYRFYDEENVLQNMTDHTTPFFYTNSCGSILTGIHSTVATNLYTRSQIEKYILSYKGHRAETVYALPLVWECKDLKNPPTLNKKASFFKDNVSLVEAPKNYWILFHYERQFLKTYPLTPKNKTLLMDKMERLIKKYKKQNLHFLVERELYHPWGDSRKKAPYLFIDIILDKTKSIFLHGKLISFMEDTT